MCVCVCRCPRLHLHSTATQETNDKMNSSEKENSQNLITLSAALRDYEILFKFRKWQMLKDLQRPGTDYKQLVSVWYVTASQTEITIYILPEIYLHIFCQANVMRNKTRIILLSGIYRRHKTDTLCSSFTNNLLLLVFQVRLAHTRKAR